jgi:hypothetical protein
MSKWLAALDAALSREIPQRRQRANLQNPQKLPFESFEGDPVEGMRDFLSEVCIDCKSFTADYINPIGGLGRCAMRERLIVGAARACSDFVGGEPKVGADRASFLTE